MKEWFSLATAITAADLHPWVQFHGWHAENAIEVMQKLDWISLVHGCCFSYNLQSMIFPSMLDSMQLAHDSSLEPINARVIGFLCTDSKDFNDKSRHYWFVKHKN